jgi:hypothetical protein
MLDLRAMAVQWFSRDFVMEQHLLAFHGPATPAVAPVSPILEMGAYEFLWARPKMTFARLAALFRDNPTAMPSDLVDRTDAERMAGTVLGLLSSAQQHPGTNRYFFPERNITMSALTEATIIVEAGETSGTLIQARAALQQGRKLFILDSCFTNPALTWPEKFVKRGAIRVRDYDDIKTALAP